MMGEHEDWRMEWRIRSPPAAPLLLRAKSGPRTGLRWAELSPAHDLGADAIFVPFGERVVDTHAAAGLTEHRAPEPGGKHPFMQAMPGMPKRLVERETFAGAEPVKRDREAVHANLRHYASSTLSDCELQPHCGMIAE